MTPTEVAERVLELSKADDCIVIVEESSSVNVRFANNTTTTNGSTRGQEVIVVSIRDRRVGVVARNWVDETSLEDLVREGEKACEFQQPAEDYAELVSGSGEPPDWNAPAKATSVSVFERFTKDLAIAFAQAETDDQKLFGYAEHNGSTLWLATSRGIRRRYDQFKGQVELTAKTADFTSSTWIGQATKDFKDIDLPKMVASLRDRLEWSKTKLDLPAGKYDTLLTPSAVADLLIYAYWTGSARDAVEGRTVFSKAGGETKIGDRLAPESVTIYSDPFEKGLEVPNFEIVAGSSSYASVFDNGVPLAKTNWLENGVLKHLITPRYWAAKTNQMATPYIDNLVVQAKGTESLEELVKGVKRGLLVTCLWYIREVDPQRLLLTGLTRDGVFLIEDGKIKGAVNNFRFNMSPIEMLGRISAAGETVPTLAREWGDYFTFAKMPPLVIHDFDMSSVSQAT
jgi:predicted Zn-dependent protease